MTDKIETKKELIRELDILRQRVATLEQSELACKRAEEALREGEDKHRILLEQSSDPIFSFAPEGQYTYVNRAFAEGVGKPVEDILGKSIWDVFPKEEADRRFVPLSQVFRTGEGKVIEVRVPRAEGDRYYVTTITPVKDTAGKVVSAICSSKDITERKRMERNLREREARLRSIFRAAPVGIGLVVNRIFKEANDRLCEMLGFPRDELMSQSAHLIYPSEEDYNYVGTEKYRQIQERGTGCVETRWKRKDGQIIDVVLSSTPLNVEDWSEGIIFTALDITERKRAEEALRESEERHRAILQTAMDGFWMVDTQGQMLEVNETYCRMSGYSERELLAMRLPDLEAFKTAGDTATHIQKIMAQGEDRFESRHRRKDGTFFDVEISVQYQPTHGGRLVAFLRDLTGRKRAVEALRESEARFRTLVERAPEAIFVQSDGRFVYINPAMVSLLGASKGEELLDKEYTTRVAPEYHEAIRARIRLQNETGKPVALMEQEYLRLDGSRVPVETTAVPVRFQDNDSHLVFVRDITERKQAEKALMETQRRLKRAQTIGHLGNWEIDLLTRKVWASEEAFRIYGIDWENESLPLELVQQCVLPEYRLEMDEALRQLISENREYDLQFQIKRFNDGGVRFLNSKAERILDKEGRTVKIAGVVQDITEHKRAEEEREKLQEQFIQAQKMESVGRLAGGVAHDFNNKLGVIMGYAEMALSQVAPGEKLHRQLEQILESARRSADLTRQLLAFARKQTVSPKVLDLNDTIEGMLKMLRRLIGEDIDLGWNPGGNLWKLKIDPSQVDQVLANLAVNARDAISGTGAVNLKTENIVLDDVYCADHPGCNPGEYVLLKMSDTGSGMSQEVLDQIFEPFFTTKGLGRGTGLGLSTVYGIVKQNDGFIEVSSEPGKGTTFKIYLPRFEGETTQSIEETEETPEGTETILLAEDDEPLLNLIRTILEGLGYTILTAQTPEQAIRLIMTYARDIHLLITDVVMPEMNGRELAERITAIKPGLKCLYISGYTADVIARQGVLFEGIHFIQKPFKKSEIAKRVREILDAHP